jgi:hypothetical protein
MYVHTKIQANSKREKLNLNQREARGAPGTALIPDDDY